MERKNLNENLVAYNKHFSEGGFWEVVKNHAKSIGQTTVKGALTIFYMYQDGLSLGDKLLVLGALGYLILPADLLPDAIPMFGFSDDAAAIGYVYSKLKDKATDEVKAKVEAKMKQWFNNNTETVNL